MRSTLCITLILLIFLSCNKDVKDIIIEGVVKESNTGKVLSNIDVTVICWKYGDSPDQSYTEDETKTITTDIKGKYLVKFDKGAFVEVKISLDGYIEGYETKEIYQKKSLIDVILKQR